MRFANQIWNLSLRAKECGIAKTAFGHFSNGARGILTDIGGAFDSEIYCVDCGAALFLRSSKADPDGWTLADRNQTALSGSCAGRQQSKEMIAHAVRQGLDESSEF